MPSLPNPLAWAPHTSKELGCPFFYVLLASTLLAGLADCLCAMIRRHGSSAVAWLLDFALSVVWLWASMTQYFGSRDRSGGSQHAFRDAFVPWGWMFLVGLVRVRVGASSTSGVIRASGTSTVATCLFVCMFVCSLVHAMASLTFADSLSVCCMQCATSSLLFWWLGTGVPIAYFVTWRMPLFLIWPFGWLMVILAVQLFLSAVGISWDWAVEFFFFSSELEAELPDKPIFRYIRHPMLGAMTMLSMGCAVLSRDPFIWSSTCVKVAVLFLLVRKLDVDMTFRSHSYAEYMKRVRALLPSMTSWAKMWHIE